MSPTLRRTGTLAVISCLKVGVLCPKGTTHNSYNGNLKNFPLMCEEKQVNTASVSKMPFMFCAVSIVYEFMSRGRN